MHFGLYSVESLYLVQSTTGYSNCASNVIPIIQYASMCRMTSELPAARDWGEGVLYQGLHMSGSQFEFYVLVEN